MPSDLQVTNIKANDGTAGLVIADSTGRVTVTETNPSITLGSNATFPKGVFTNVNSVVQRISSGSAKSFNAAGNGEQIIEYNEIITNTDDSAFTQNILSLSSYYFTLNTGYYYWQARHIQYGCSHGHHYGLRTYGGTDGTGTTVGNITTANVNHGSTFGYTTDVSSFLMENSGIVKVTHNTQKYGMYIYVQGDTFASWSTTSYGTNHNGITAKADFWKIGNL